MAGDWIKVEHVTPDKPEVVAISVALGIDQDAVFGKLCRFWMWADQQSLNGHALRVTEIFIDRVCCHTGMAQALRNVGWLSGENGSLNVPNFKRHNGQTAKARGLAYKRQKLKRSRMKRDKSVTRERVRERVDITNVISTSECETIYEMYPKKVGRPSALKAIRVALGKTTAAELSDAVQAFAKARAGQDQQFTPNPATWFNQERWKDDRSTWNQSTGKHRIVPGGNTYDENAGANDPNFGKF